METGRIWHFREFFHFYTMLDIIKSEPAQISKIPTVKSIDLYLVMRFMLKELFWGSTNFTVAIFKMPQISKHFSAMLYDNATNQKGKKG